jgi:hypothetical protein
VESTAANIAGVSVPRPSVSAKRARPAFIMVVLLCAEAYLSHT